MFEPSAEQAEYNAKVQDMQRFCIECGLQHRVRSAGVEGEKIRSAYFEVYYNGWRVLGIQTDPMTPQTTYSYFDQIDAETRAEVAYDLCH